MINPIRAVFVGDGSLVVRCVEAFVQAGHQVACIASADAAVLAWAQDEGLPCEQVQGLPLVPRLAGADFDVLFSIGWLHRLPPPLLAQARRIALNFHDGPLPRHGGLNAPAWALLEGAHHHGVTWHEMTSALDAGRIACELSFDLSPDETALSLNTHCYEAGFRSFLTLMDLLARDALVLRRPLAPPRLHGRHQRPAALATLDWRRPAAELAAQCRALDFGPTPNPLACPKLWCGGRLLRVGSAQSEAPTDPPLAPGCVLAQEADRLWLATGQGTLRLEGLVALDGGPLPVLVPGQLLEPLPFGRLQRLAEARPALARGEAAWRPRLLALAAGPLAAPPHPRRHALAGPELSEPATRQTATPETDLQEPDLRDPGLAESDIDATCIAATRTGAPSRPRALEVPLPVDPVTCAMPGHTLLAGCAAWLAAVSGEPRAALAWRDPFLVQASEGLAPHVALWWPLLLNVARDTRAADLRESAGEALALARADGPITADLPQRLGRSGPQVPALGVCIGPWPEGLDLDAPGLCLMVPALADALPGQLAEPAQGAEAGAQADASQAAAATPGPWRLRVDARMWTAPVALEMAAQLAAWLPRFARHAGAVGALSLLPPSDLDRLAELHDGAQTVDQRGGLWAAVARGLARHPEAVALEWDSGTGGPSQSLSRAELARRVDALAALLRARGVGRRDLVGVCLPRGPQLLVAVLAILARGGAYLPLDPDYPADRLRFMCRDAGLRRVIGADEAATVLGMPLTAMVSPLDAWPGEGAGAEADAQPHAQFGAEHEVGGPAGLGLVLGQATPPRVEEGDEDAEDDEGEDGYEGQDEDDEVETEELLPADLGYLIYTSGSTGLPKGVEISQGSVLNFFAGMDAVLADAKADHDAAVAGRWLAVTSLSFDISVLELLWTLSRGFTVVMHGAGPTAALGASATAAIPNAAAAPATAALMPGGAPQWSLFHFASEREGADTDDAGAAYRLLIDAARFADTHGFAAIWTPERHFHGFGGPFPNPALISAALAMVTRHVQLRAGSCVLPLHHPLTVAEDWALVDRLSGGRVGVSFAAGWQPQDFVLAPAAWAGRRQQMFEGIDAVRRLWRGEALAWPGPEGQTVTVRTLPRPVQAELPVWVTVAGNPQTFAEAGRAGCHVLTHLLGQSVPELAAKVSVYRAAWDVAGHPGRGQVALMLHTFVGDDEDAVREAARAPLKAYLREAMDLIRRADWRFPTFAAPAASGEPVCSDAGRGGPSVPTTRAESPVHVGQGDTAVQADGQRAPGGGLADFAEHPPTAQETEALLEHAFERYARGSALIGTPERCMDLVAQLAQLGLDEIACLIDFGIPADEVLAHLPDLHRLKGLAQVRLGAGAEAKVESGAVTVPAHRPGAHAEQAACRALSVGAALTRHRITHLQCTPSQAAILLVDDAGRQGLSQLSALLVGGEALPPTMAGALRDQVPGLVLNMYGPTEATVWCSAWALPARVPGARQAAGAGPMAVSLGRPLARTGLHLRNTWGQECPAFVPGELCVSGVCLARGYHARPALDAERFVDDPLRPGRRLYRTGDQVQREPDGRLAFLGRADHQVKVRGHRIELGEIEAALASQHGVHEAVVVACRDGVGDAWLQAFVTPRPGQSPQPLDLARALARQLPEFMLPRGIALRDALPKTPNGKVDRQALAATGRAGGSKRPLLSPQPHLQPHLSAQRPATPRPQAQVQTPAMSHPSIASVPAPPDSAHLFETRTPAAFSVTPDAAPVPPAWGHHLAAIAVTRAVLTAAPDAQRVSAANDQGAKEEAREVPELAAFEALVAQTWRAVLGKQEIGHEVNFFDLGGHSLAVIQVQRRLREACGIEIPVIEMFRLTTIASLARHLAAQAGASAAPVATPTVSVGQDRALARRALRDRLTG